MQVELPASQGGSVTVKVWIGKEWDPVNWKGDVWVDFDEAGGLEVLNPDEFSLPVEAASSSL